MVNVQHVVQIILQSLGVCYISGTVFGTEDIFLMETYYKAKCLLLVMKYKYN